MSIQLAILIGYVVLMAWISWKSTQIKESGGGGKLMNYLMAGQRMPTSLVAIMICALAVGGASTVGVAEQAYTLGISAGWYNAAWGIGGIVVGLFFASKYRSMSQRTVPEMIGTAFGDGARLIGVVAQLIIMMSITSLQYVAGGAVLTSLLPEVFPTLGLGMAVSAVIVIGITLTGGYWATGLTNIIYVVLIYVGIFAALFAGFDNFGGFDAVVGALPPGPWFDPVSGIGIAIITGWIAVMTTQACATQAVVQISLAAKDEKAARNGFIIGGILILPVGFLCAFFGIMAAAKLPGLKDAALALPMIVSSINPVVGGIFLAGLWAAAVSTAVAILMACSTLLVLDVWKRLVTKSYSPNAELTLSRAAVLLVTVCSYGLAITAVGILRTMTTALAVTASFTLLILMLLYAPRLCKKSSGFWTILASIVAWALWTYVPSTRIGPHLIYLEWVVCPVVFALCCLLDKRPAKPLI